MNTNTNYTYETEIPDTLLADLPEEARDQENINRVSFTYWQTCWKRMKKDKLAMFGIVGDHCDGDTGRFWPDALSVFL